MFASSAHADAVGTGVCSAADRAEPRDPIGAEPKEAEVRGARGDAAVESRPALPDQPREGSPLGVPRGVPPVSPSAHCTRGERIPPAPRGDTVKSGDMVAGRDSGIGIARGGWAASMSREMFLGGPLGKGSDDRSSRLRRCRAPSFTAGMSAAAPCQSSPLSPFALCHLPASLLEIFRTIVALPARST